MCKRLLPLLLALCVPLLLASPALAEPIALEKLEVAAINEPTAEQKADGEPGAPDVQAGSHPYALVTTFFLNGPEEVQEGKEASLLPTGGGLKNVVFELPPGFVGNPDATPKCNYSAFFEKLCPNDTAVGEASTVINTGSTSEPVKYQIITNPVYNVETPGGVAAEFGYLVKEVVPVFLESSVRTGGDYGITVSVRDISQVREVIASRVTIWGVPAAAVHDPVRGRCLGEGETYFLGETPEQGLLAHDEEVSSCSNPGVEGAGGLPVQPLLTNPTSCGVPRTARMSIESWGESAEPPTKSEETVTLPELVGCEKLDFSPTLSVTPDGTAGSTPTGLNVDVHVSQESTTNPEGLGEADVKNTTVALPAGVQVSPSASDGLQACSNAQIGFEGFREFDESGVQSPAFTDAAPSCPDASKIANVTIATPLLEHELTGAVYLAAPQNFAGLPDNPFSSLIAMYLVAEEPEHGVLIKLPGKVSLNEATGQITTTFEDTPQLPFSELKLEFFGTARAPLATPARCGTYDAEASFEPWSGTSAVHPPASFQITSGPATVSEPGGTPCPGAALPFSPTLASGTTNVNGGSYSDLTTTLGREDGQQQIQQVTLHYPPGLTGLLSGVKLCGEAQANAGTCGPESEIGESIVSVGLGNDPFTVIGGRVYITEKYEGAPFGLSIVNPAKAGPFVLQEGRPVVVRAKIEVDPLTAALTVTTNTAAQGYAIPSMIEGIPLQIKHVNVLVDRPGFTINPTSCEPMKISASIASAEGASSPVSIPFQVANCTSLAFKPGFAASTSGKTSRRKGASLHVDLTYPKEAIGKDANVHEVKVELPKALPSRLSTLQKACLAATFEANPASCPPESAVGHAKAITPLLPVPLEGPAYFVSYGGAKFPELVLVLQGYGVTIDLHGETFINKQGITSSTFHEVPDQPVESFELTLPQGPDSALAAPSDLCKKSLKMPTTFVGQNGATFAQDTSIEVEGCPSTISFTGRVSKRTATLEIYVPAKGRLKIRGKGLSSASKSVGRRSTVEVKLRQKKAGRLSTKVTVTFVAAKGHKQVKHGSLKFRR